MKNQFNYFTSILALSLFFVVSCMPTIIKSIRLYDRNTGKVINLVLSDPKYNRGEIYTSQYDVDQGSEIFDGEYHIHGRTSTPGPKYERVKPFANSIAEEYGFGKNSGAKPVGTGIIVGSEGTVIEIIFYDVQGQLKSGDGLGRDNNGNIYRVYLREEEI